MLVAGVVGSGIMGERLAEGNVAIALLANSTATAFLLFGLIHLMGPISGAQFNPVVSLSAAIVGELPWRRLLPFVMAQIVGGVLGTLIAHGMFDHAAFVWSERVRTGPAQWLAEVMATFGLILTILGVSRSRPEAVPLAVALYIGAAYWFTASTSFANPAVTIARTLTDTFSGIRPADAPAFIAAQVVGALLAVGAWRWIAPARSPKAGDSA
ncbi:MAG: aquaporin family protein [Alphaproteobacteria bacterium]|nr:aquaporin family protein [Alphaproteobacteria bacterium]